MEPIKAIDFHLEEPSIQQSQGFYQAAIESVHEVNPWMDWCNPDLTMEEIEKLILEDIAAWKNNEYYCFTIIDRISSDVIGHVIINHINREHKVANMGYWVRTSRTGHGYASRACRLVAEYIFTNLGLHRLEIIVPEGNVASHQVAIKCNAKDEGSMRERVCIHGKHYDATMYSLLRSDLE